ncbi:MAG: TerB family tellurite resistance protein [Oscillospiraceae bacterium]|nr:TerB family tellurite resistance protein [Oscillospiraceae bacterium]
MDKLQKYSEEFKFEYDKFITGCDSIEEMGQWDVEKLGQMDAYYSGDIMSVIIRLVAADGQFTQKEADYVNDIFGFAYTPGELRSIYEDCGDAIDSVFDEGVENGYSRIKGINEKLAAAYKELLTLVCDIIIESDGVIDGAEIAMAQRLKTL